MTVARVPHGALLIAGDDLALIAYAVRRAVRGRASDRLSPIPRLDALAEALAASAALTSPVAATGHADTAAHPTGDDGRMTTTDVARMLGCSERTARRLAPGLGGRRIGGRWHLDAAAVAEHIAGQAS